MREAAAAARMRGASAPAQGPRGRGASEEPGAPEREEATSKADVASRPGTPRKPLAGASRASVTSVPQPQPQQPLPLTRASVTSVPQPQQQQQQQPQQPQAVPRTPRRASVPRVSVPPWVLELAEGGGGAASSVASPSRQAVAEGRYKPAEKLQRFAPQERCREKMIKDKLTAASSTFDLKELLGIHKFVMGFGNVSANNQVSLVHGKDVDVMRKRIRQVLRKRAADAVEQEDLQSLQALFHEVDGDRLLSAIASFAEFEQARVFAQLKASMLVVEALAAEGAATGRVRADRAAAALGCLDRAVAARRKVQACSPLADAGELLLNRERRRMTHLPCGGVEGGTLTQVWRLESDNEAYCS